MKINIVPPKIPALFESAVPNFFPSISPKKHIKNVTVAIINEHKSAVRKLYPAMVKPTERASMEVAIP